MKRKSLALAMMAVMLAGSALTVRAEHHLVGGDQWKVQFTGKEMKSTFTSQDITNAISAIEPGDDIEIKIKLENTDSRKATWYMTNEVLQTLEESQNAASGGAYTYNLTYTSGDSTQEPLILYDSENVGGEKNSAAGEGLKEVMSSLDDKDWLYMDQLKPKGTGTISLTVGLDGETQGNGYQNTLARLQLNFAVERAAAASSSGGSGGSGGGSGSSGGGTSSTPAPAPASVVYSPGAVQTGDPSSMLLWSAAALTSGLALMVFVVCFYKKKREE